MLIRSLLLLGLVPLVAPAQLDTASRYELGQRLRYFERSLEKYGNDTDNGAKAIARAIPPVAKATPAFFGGRLTEAARILDTARLSLAEEMPPPEQLWALSLVTKPARRLLDTKDGKLAVRVERFYKLESADPEGLSLRLSYGPLKPQMVALTKLPVEVSIPWDKLPEADHPLVSEVVRGETVLSRSEQTISAVDRLEERLKALREQGDAKTVATATRKHLTSILTDLAAGRTLETNYPAVRLLRDAEAILADQWNPQRPGQHWLSLPGVTGSPVRLQVPAGLKKDQRVPIVFALHGAGGSENMFFDGYGDGLVAKLASQRGWLVVAPRSGLFGGPDVPAVLDALASIYPIDGKRVFILGHSMGAAQTAATIGRAPQRFAAAACLGGGGGFKPSEALKKLPVFVGVGKLDFAARGAKSLADALEKAGVEKVTFKVYEDLEHLTIVQRALPEVFALFDRIALK
ncbi:MAG: prolyl oligopeptidase family serine peptidase [Gemmataceae bacterium]